MENRPDLDMQLDEALKSMPLAPLPSGLVANIMQQIQPALSEVDGIAFEPEPFRLRGSDVFVAAIISLLFAFFVLVGLNWLGVMDVAWLSAEIPHIPWLNSTTLIALTAVPLELILAYALYEAFADIVIDD